MTWDQGWALGLMGCGAILLLLARWRTGLWPWEWRARDEECERTLEDLTAEVAALNAQLLQMLGPEEFAKFQRRLAESDGRG